MSADGRPTILLVEDNRGDAMLIRDLIYEWRPDDIFEVVHVTSLAAAIDLLRRLTPACVLLDLGLPDADGLEVVSDCRAAAPLVPIVVLTGRADDALGAQSLRCGAQDYLVKGQVDARLLIRCVRHAAERMRMEASLNHLALYDSLTGVGNRILFHNRLQAGLARSRRHELLVALMIIDLDRFKEVNDRFGHPAGDELLRVVSARMQASLRSEDTLARLGGDEFAVLCEDVHDREEVVLIARRLLLVIAQPVATDEGAVRVEGSLGIAYAMPWEQPETVLRNADRAMYRAKRRGSGRFEVFEPEMSNGRDAAGPGPLPLGRGGRLRSAPPYAEIAACREAHGRLLQTVTMLTDHQMRQPSLLPGWSRGHVLSHLARHGDSVVQRLAAAAEGRGIEVRRDEIVVGSRRSAAALIEDVRRSAQELDSALNRYPEDAWERATRAVDGTEHPARALAFSRWQRVEVHHVDLNLEYRARDWPSDLVERWLPTAIEGLARQADDSTELLAWLLGRGPAPLLEPWG